MTEEENLQKSSLGNTHLMVGKQLMNIWHAVRKLKSCTDLVLNTTYDPKFGFTYMGLYEGVKKGITLWNNRHYQVPCDIRTFINTLLHEFMHHYDFYYLRLPDSVHCKGFESRIRDLRKKLQS